MSEIIVGHRAPDFALPASDGNLVELAQYRGQYVILYFYSKDNTSGCTLETREFGELHGEWKANGAVVLGISRDSVKSHQKFAEKLEIPFLLLSDAGGAVCTLYEVLKEKTMYGKKVIGVERSTFIVDPDGNVCRLWRKVKAAGHAATVLATIKEIRPGVIPSWR